MARFKKWTPVIVEWRDAVTIHEQSNSEDQNEPARRRSIGFLLRRTREQITIAMEDDRHADLGGDNDCQVMTTIPRGMVRKVIALRVEDELPNLRK